MLDSLHDINTDFWNHPMNAIPVPISSQGEGNYDDPTGQLEDSQGATKRSGENNPNIWEGHTGPWGRELFLSWQIRDSQPQPKPRSCLILCNPQLEQLILQGVMLSVSGISTESFARWTCVHSDASRQLLSARAEPSH